MLCETILKTCTFSIEEKTDKKMDYNKKYEKTFKFN